MNFPSVSQFSIAKGTGGTNPPEMYIPLWWYSGNADGLGGSASTGVFFILKGAIGTMSNGTSSSATHLITLNSNWSPSTKYAFEVAVYANNSATASVQLYDVTGSSLVAGSLVSTSSTTMTVIRSGQFTLTPGHVYAVSVGCGSSNSAFITDASLIVFPQ